jgi:short-subunit dehydrogenase
MDLQNKRVVVTGASRGIGAEIARALAAKGAHVAVVARSAEPLEKLAHEIGGRAYPADLMDRASRDGVIPRIEADGPIDVLVNNAGLLDTVAFVAMDRASIDALIDVNLHAPLQLTRATLPAMLARGSGYIVDISSMAGASCTPGVAAYSATKAGLTHFNACLRNELLGTGVQLGIVELGPVDTEMEENLHTHAPTHRSMQRLRMLRLIRHIDPSRVAAAVTRMIERDATYLRMPKRAAAFPIIAAVPRQIGRVLLAGIDRRSP